MFWLDMPDSGIERSRFGPWSGSLSCFFGKGTLLSQCLFPTRNINGYLLTVRETLEILVGVGRGVTCDRLSLHKRRVAIP